MQWKIVTDSGCDMPEIKAGQKPGQGEIGFERVPFTITIEGEEYVDTKSLKVAEMLWRMEEGEEPGRTSCPSPAAWLAAYEGAEQVIVITMSGALSGSCRCAAIARELFLEEHPERQVYILDSRSAGVGIGLQVQQLIQNILEGKSGEELIRKAEIEREQVQVLFALFHFENLIKAGRMHRLIGYAVNRLKLCLIGTGNREGKIEILHKIRGEHRVCDRLIEDMEERGFDGKTVMISHCFHRKAAERLAHRVKERWPEAEVRITQMHGICSYYAERGGLMIAYRKRSRR